MSLCTRNSWGRLGNNEPETLVQSRNKVIVNYLSLPFEYLWVNPGFILQSFPIISFMKSNQHKLLHIRLSQKRERKKSRLQSQDHLKTPWLKFQAQALWKHSFNLFAYWKCNFPMTPHVRRLVGRVAWFVVRSVCRSVAWSVVQSFCPHNFLKGRKLHLHAL